MNKKTSITDTTAVDMLGRALPVGGETLPTSRKNRTVGLFYFLWCGEHGRHKPYNISEIAATHPNAGAHPELFGDIGVYNHWGEPFYGYYYSDDEWVIRRHMRLITAAGVDFLFFDTTNAVIYEKNVKLVMRVLHEYNEAGLPAPKVMFYTNTASGKTVQEIYDKIYKTNYMSDTWFFYNGKPLIIADINDCSPETRDFFTIKFSQWPNEPDKPNGWPWMDFTRPQRVFEDLEGNPEVINVSVAQHPQLRFGDSLLYGEDGNCGRSFHNGKNDYTENAYLYGYNFAEQFERALEADPPVVLITGWNEWIAGHWNGTSERPVMFVDTASPEYSRDIEMMRGGYFDNYYLQMISYIRRYKGASVPMVHTCGEIAEYPCFPDGDFIRDNDGYGTHYENRTARNAITSLSVLHNTEKLFFKIGTKAPLVTQNGDTVKLFISANRDYIANGSSLFTADGTTPQIKFCDIICNVAEYSLTYEIPLK